MINIIQFSTLYILINLSNEYMHVAYSSIDNVIPIGMS